MHYRRLGRTGLRVSLLGLGTGGARRMGQASGHTSEQQHALVHRCLDLGVNLFDTSEIYDETEVTLGEALAGVPRSSYVLSTKWLYAKGGTWPADGSALRASVERSLSRLRTDHVDVMMFHALRPEDYDRVLDLYVPEMLRLRQEGLVRHIGFSERFPDDPGHSAATMALTRHPQLWDVVEIKYGILNQLAAREALPLALEHDVGVVNMAAVRVRLPDPALLEETMAEWTKAGYLAAGSLPAADPLGWLVHDDVESVVSAGYKFAASHTAVSTVLNGTSSIGHLEANVRALEIPELSPEDARRLVDLFGEVCEYA